MVTIVLYSQNEPVLPSSSYSRTNKPDFYITERLIGQEYFWSKDWQEAESEANEDIKSGRVKRFSNTKEAIDYLHSEEDQMNLDFTKKFKRQYKKKSLEQQEKIDKAVELLGSNPYHPGLHTHKVQGTIDIFECYIDDTHRITFEYGDDCIILRNNCEHDMTLKSP